MKHTVLIILLFLSYHALAVLPDPVKEFNYQQMLLEQDKLQKEFSQNKSLSEQFKLAELIALSYYPELEDVNIEFMQKDIKTTMQSIPQLDFIFRKKQNRVYHIISDNKVKKKKGIVLADVPFNAQVGVVGHELAHVVDYQSKSAVGVILLGIGYIFPNRRRKIENRVDEITIQHGLGHQVKDFSDYVINNKELNEKYLKYKRKYYYSPAQLLNVMLKYPIY